MSASHCPPKPNQTPSEHISKLLLNLAVANFLSLLKSSQSAAFMVERLGGEGFFLQAPPTPSLLKGEKAREEEKASSDIPNLAPRTG